MWSVNAPVIVSISENGITASVKGAKKHLTANWPQIIAAMVTPSEVLSYLHGKPIEFLQRQAEKKGKRPQ